jgi:hypothetical protein
VFSNAETFSDETKRVCGEVRIKLQQECNAIAATFESYGKIVNGMQGQMRNFHYKRRQAVYSALNGDLEIVGDNTSPEVHFPTRQENP